MNFDFSIGTLVFSDGTRAGWELVEKITPEPACYQWDTGVIVETSPNVLYFISIADGAVYTHEDGDKHSSLTRKLEGVYCPEIQKVIEKEREDERKMEEAIAQLELWQEKGGCNS